MAKKQITPTSESIRKAYIQEFLKRKADAEAFASRWANKGNENQS